MIFNTITALGRSLPLIFSRKLMPLRVFVFNTYCRGLGRSKRGQSFFFILRQAEFGKVFFRQFIVRTMEKENPNMRSHSVTYSWRKWG